MKSEDGSTRNNLWWRGVLAASALLALLVSTAQAPAGAPMVTSPEKAAELAATNPAVGPEITVENFRFNPARVTVPVGTAVTWMNRDDEPHTVTSSDKLFASPGLDTGDAFSHRFTTPGTYVYFCTLHPHMTGTIIVR